MKINIAISAYNRPEYLQRCISALYGAKGFSRQKYGVFCAMDCHEDGSINKDVLSVFMNHQLVPDVAETKQGCNFTVKKALDLAWASRPDFVLMIEDDIIISDDALLYIEWAAETYKQDRSVRTIGLWGHDKGPSPSKVIPQEQYTTVMRQNYFTCWGWGTWPDRWAEINAKWTTGGDSHETSWDVIVSQSLGNRTEILPSVSRAYNCGELNGTHRGRAWPGLVASGLVDPDGLVSYSEVPVLQLEERWPVYVVLGRYGDIYMVCKHLKQPSIICCMSEFAQIVYELFPQHKVFELGTDYTRDPVRAAGMCQMKWPYKKVVVCQQDGQDPALILPFRNFQAFQEHYAQL